MDFKKKLVILVSIIVVLSASFILGWIFSPENVQKRRLNVPLYSKLDIDRVNKIEVRTKDSKIDIVRNGSEWSVLIGNEPYPANPNKVDSVLKEIVKLKQGRVISKNPDNWKDFDVTTEKAKSIIFYDKNNKKIVDLLVGKPGIGGSGYYVRRNGDNTVFQVERDVSYYLNVKDDFWSYLKIFPKDLKEEQVIRIEIKKSIPFDDKDNSHNYQYALYKSGDKKKESEWKIEGKEKQKIDEDKVTTLVRDILGLEGVRFVTDKKPEDVGLVNAKTTLSIGTENDKKYEIVVGNKNAKEEQFYVRLKGGKYIYLVSTWQLKRIFKDMKELYKKEDKKEEAK